MKHFICSGKYSSEHNSEYPHASRIISVKYEQMTSDMLNFTQQLKRRIFGSNLDNEAVAWIKKNLIDHRPKGNRYQMSEEFSREVKEVEVCANMVSFVNYKF